MTTTVARPGYEPEQRELDPQIPDELAELEKQFQTQTSAGMMAVATRTSGVREHVKSFDPEAREITYHAPLVGG